MNHENDPYHSRNSDTWEAAPRVDPTASDQPGPLTTDEVWNYAHDGFLFAQGLFSQEEVDELLAEATSLGKDWPESQPGIVREPGSDEVRSIFRLHKISDTYQRLFADERLLTRAKQLIGTDVYIHQSRINYKPAMNGKEFFWHSDFETWHVEDGMPRMRALSVSVFLTESHEFNGPLMLIPGSHETYIRCAGITMRTTMRIRCAARSTACRRGRLSKRCLKEGRLSLPKVRQVPLCSLTATPCMVPTETLVQRLA